MQTREDLVAKSMRPGQDALRLHRFYRGKVEVVPKCRLGSFEDFSIWYTPGVAEPCRAIQADASLVYELTNKWNSVAVVSDGSRVLGLGDIGPEAGLPVMEGKALLFKYLGGVDAYPICLGTKDAREIIQAVKWLKPSFGGINLEDIEQPKCYEILETLRAEMDIPVWHDDQQGTAAVVLAGLLNAVKVVGKELARVRIALIGSGAANMRTAKLIMRAGADPGNIVMCDSKGTLHRGRADLAATHKEKWEMCLTTNAQGVEGHIPDAMRGADVVIALSVPGPDVIHREWVTAMAEDAIVFACANPVPEIWPWDAKEAGARVVATGRSDFENQVNNSLGFPAIFRGTLDVRGKAITDEMCVAAAMALAEHAQEKGLHEGYIIPAMDDWDVYPKEAVAVALKAIEQGVARVTLSREELYQSAVSMMQRARGLVAAMNEGGLVPTPA